MRLITLMKALFLATGVSADLQAENVHGWRMDGTGRYPEANPVTEWSVDKNVQWATVMPDWSNSTPIITGNRLFVCAEPASLVCLELDRGAILWERDNGLDQVGGTHGRKTPGTHNTNGYSSPTPVTDGRHVVVLFGNGVAAAYDLDGNRRWIQCVGEPSHGWGHSASPALADGVAVFLVHDHLIGLDATTGRQRWRLPAEARWGSPVVAAIGQTPVLVTPNGRLVRAADGHVLDDSLPKLDYSSPVVADGVVYFIEGKASAYRLPRSDKGTPQRLWTQRIKGSRHYASPLIHEGMIYTISREEHLTMLDAASGEIVFRKKFDINGVNSAYSSPTLGGRYVFFGFEAGTTIVVKAGRRYEEVARNRLESYRSSPVFREGRMYLRTRGHLYCIGGDGPVAMRPVP